MKKKLSKILAIFLTVMLMVSGASATEIEKETVNAKNSATQNILIRNAVNAALEADGIEAERCNEVVLNVFQEDVSSFLNVFQSYTEEEQNRILWIIAESAVLSESDEFLYILSSFDEEDVVYKKLVENYESIIDLINSISNESPIEAPQYDTDTIILLASAYLENQETENMELMTHLAKAYYAEPTIMADAFVQKFNNMERQQLATGIVRAYAQTENNELHAIAEIRSSFQEELAQALKEQDKMGVEHIAPRATVYTPTITSFSYSGTIEVGKPTKLTIKLTETAGTSTARSYTVKIYCTRNGTEYQKSSVNMTIPKNSTTSTKDVTYTFSHPGTFTTRVAVYSGTNLLVEREGRSPDVSYGNWKTVCTFQEDRTKYGVFALYNAAGELQETGDCLGLSVKNIDENLPYGNTPCGTYTGCLIGPITENPTSYGPYKCVDADAVNVPCINNGVRKNGMWIHGGRSQTKLQPTEGCVRVFDADMLDIQNSIETMTRAENGHYRVGNVIYQEV